MALKPPDDLAAIMKPGERLIRVYWVARGESRRGRITKRDGRHVDCGHRHRTQEAAERCAVLMREKRPGNCQRYEASQVFMTVRRVR